MLQQSKQITAHAAHSHYQTYTKSIFIPLESELIPNYIPSCTTLTHQQSKSIFKRKKMKTAISAQPVRIVTVCLSHVFYVSTATKLPTPTSSSVCQCETANSNTTNLDWHLQVDELRLFGQQFPRGVHFNKVGFSVLGCLHHRM